MAEAVTRPIARGDRREYRSRAEERGARRAKMASPVLLRQMIKGVEGGQAAPYSVSAISAILCERSVFSAVSARDRRSGFERHQPRGLGNQLGPSRQEQAFI